jgi:Flp pilus assembly protein TadD
MHAAIASAHFFAGRYREALAWAGTALRFKPNDALATTVTAASSALSGELAQAHTAMAHLREIDPALRISNLRDQFPIDRPEHMARWAEGLSKAGLPD